MKMRMGWVRGLVMLAVLGGVGAVSAVAQGSAAAVKDDLFAGTEIFAKGARDVTDISMDPDTLGLVGGRDGSKAHNMILNVVRTYSYDKPGMYRMEDVDTYRNKLQTGDWHCSIHIRSSNRGESTDICSKSRTDDLVETAIITVEPRELTFIHTIRRKSGPGQSELSGFMFDEVEGLPLMATLEPKLLELEMSLQHMQLPDVDAIESSVTEALRGLPTLDSADMEKSVDAARKQMENARQRMENAQKQMESARQQMKDSKALQMQKQMDEPEKHLRVPKDVE